MTAEPRPAIGDDDAPKIDDPAIDDDSGFVETNVIAQGSASNHEPTMTTDAAVHSASREKIMGTPFTTDSRFEYPFPNPSNTSDPSSSTLILPSSPPASPVPVLSSHARPINGFPAPSGITSFSPFLSTFPATFPTYSLTHPKLRATPPPVPPSLKKRQRWTLTLPLLRRRNSQPNDNQPSPEDADTRSASVDVTPASNTHAVIQKS